MSPTDVRRQISIFQTLFGVEQQAEHRHRLRWLVLDRLVDFVGQNKGVHATMLRLDDGDWFWACRLCESTSVADSLPDAWCDFLEHEIEAHW